MHSTNFHCPASKADFKIFLALDKLLDETCDQNLRVRPHTDL